MIWAVQGSEISAAVDEIRRSRSHRVIAIVGGAIVDKGLTHALAARMREDADEEVLSRFFAPDGALGSFSSRYTMAYLLGAIDKPTYTAMTGMGKIRNAFAHKLDVRFSSNSRDLNDGFKRLQLHEKYTHYPNPFLDQDTTNRVRQKPRNRKEQFLTNLQIIMALLMRDTVWRGPPRL